jgi:hypothetical protein
LPDAHLCNAAQQETGARKRIQIKRGAKNRAVNPKRQDSNQSSKPVAVLQCGTDGVKLAWLGPTVLLKHGSVPERRARNPHVMTSSEYGAVSKGVEVVLLPASSSAVAKGVGSRAVARG